MNSPAPGWLPDPTGRHEHRYWDGSYWTSDVSDGGVTSFDPYEAPTQQQPMGYGSSGPGYGSGPYAAQPAAGGSGGGPSTGLLVGLGAAILVVIVAIVLVVSNKDDDDKDADLATDSSGQTDDSGDDGDTTTTEADDSGDDTGDGGDRSEGDQAMIDAMAGGILATSNGALTQEDADCIAEAMFDEFGLERLMEISTDAMESGSTDPFGGMTSDEVSSLMDLMLDCVPAETLAEIGMDEGG